MESILSNLLNNIFNNLFKIKEEIDIKTLKELFKILNIEINSAKDLYMIRIYHETLKNKKLIEYFNNFVPELKEGKYLSHKLTCLHKNSLEKQKFPGINLLRQILKCNKLKLSPKLIYKGYNRVTGKKIVERYFTIEDLHVKK
jgi:hypothetical protein